MKDQQPTLFYEYRHGDRIAGYGPAAPHNGTPTSRAAATTIEPNAAETLRKRILEFLRLCGQDGATDEEIQLALDMAGNTERPRRGELANAGLIFRVFHNGSYSTRATSSGRKAVLWFATKGDS